MIYKLTSIHSVIYKIVNDLGMSDTDIPVDDFIEWIATALQHVGTYYQFTEKEKRIEIENYKGELPCDFYKLKRILYNGYYLNNNKSLIGDSKEKIESNKFTERDININHNVIIVSFERGFLDIQYLAIPVDEYGFPLVPDDVTFFEALFWRVVYQLCIRGYEFRNPRLRELEYVRMMWEKHCKRARAEGNMPDLDMIERIKNNWQRLRTSNNYHYNLFKGFGLQEKLKTKY
ncbi:MAG: hypothetical protein NZM44_02055 [Candidatus Calescibacterium sp.]|nr:hypothetical protein [Candidatus Calescibacterium sp.]